MFHDIPSAAPSSFWLGADLYDQLMADGIAADPFPPLADLGLVPLDAQQADGRWDTRDESGRRLDFIHANPAAVDAVVGTLVYDSRDDDMVELSLAGDPPDRATSATASDHFPVLVDLAIP